MIVMGNFKFILGVKQFGYSAFTLHANVRLRGNCIFMVYAPYSACAEACWAGLFSGSFPRVYVCDGVIHRSSNADCCSARGLGKQLCICVSRSRFCSRYRCCKVRETYGTRS